MPPNIPLLTSPPLLSSSPSPPTTFRITVLPTGRARAATLLLRRHWRPMAALPPSISPICRSIPPVAPTLDAGGALAAYFRPTAVLRAGGGADFAWWRRGRGRRCPVARPRAANAVAPAPARSSSSGSTDQVINGIMGQVDSSIQTVEGLTSGPGHDSPRAGDRHHGHDDHDREHGHGCVSEFRDPRRARDGLRPGRQHLLNQLGRETSFWRLPTYFSNAFSASGGSGAIASPVVRRRSSMAGSPTSSACGIRPAGRSTPSSWASSWPYDPMLIVLPSLAAMFTVFLISTFLLLVMLTIGPLMILALLFQSTRRFLHGYVSVMVTGAVFALGCGHRARDLLEHPHRHHGELCAVRLAGHGSSWACSARRRRCWLQASPWPAYPRLSRR